MNTRESVDGFRRYCPLPRRGRGREQDCFGLVGSPRAPLWNGPTRQEQRQEQPEEQTEERRQEQRETPADNLHPNRGVEQAVQLVDNGKTKGESRAV